MDDKLVFGCYQPWDTSNRTEQRLIKDRRSKKTPLINKYLFKGMRRSNRRLSDPQCNYYVDLPPKSALSVAVVICIFCLIDAFFTLYHLGRGATEVNPIMRFFLDLGVEYFLSYKLIVTVAGLLFLSIHYHFIGIKKYINIIAIVYCLVCVYQLLLWVGTHI